MTSHRSRLITGIALGLAGGVVLVAQQSTGGLRGQVTDKTSGAPLAGVAITITHQGTGFIRYGVTNAEGFYKFPILPIGS